MEFCKNPKKFNFHLLEALISIIITVVVVWTFNVQTLKAPQADENKNVHYCKAENGQIIFQGYIDHSIDVRTTNYFVLNYVKDGKLVSIKGICK